MFLGTVVMIYVLNILNSDYQLIENLSLNKTLFSVLLVLYPLIDLLRVFILRVKMVNHHLLRIVIICIINF